jgi:hypothetical protein
VSLCDERTKEVAGKRASERAMCVGVFFVVCGRKELELLH